MKRLIIPLGAIGLAMTFGSVASVEAQDAPQTQPPAATRPPAPDHGTMGGMGMKEGMGMMQRMGRMMDHCERMMQGREQGPNQPDRPPG